MNRGYIKLWRCIEDNDFYFGEKFTKAQAWIDLILLANHKDNIIFIRGVEVLVKRGFVGYSEEGLAKRWGWSRDKVRRFKNLLETRQQVRRLKNATLCQIEIVKYGIYQANNTVDNTTDNTTEKQQKNTNKNEKNVKNEKKHTESSKEDSSTELTAIPLKKDFEEFVTLYEKGWKTKLKVRTERWKKYQARRKVFTKDEILEAMRNIYHDKFLQGDNEGGKIYGDIDYILRNDKIIEKYHSNPK